MRSYHGLARSSEMPFGDGLCAEGHENSGLHYFTQSSTTPTTIKESSMPTSPATTHENAEVDGIPSEIHEMWCKPGPGSDSGSTSSSWSSLPSDIEDLRQQRMARYAAAAGTGVDLTTEANEGVEGSAAQLENTRHESSSVKIEGVNNLKDEGTPQLENPQLETADVERGVSENEQKSYSQLDISQHGSANVKPEVVEIGDTPQSETSQHGLSGVKHEVIEFGDEEVASSLENPQPEFPDDPSRLGFIPVGVLRRSDFSTDGTSSGAFDHPDPDVKELLRAGWIATVPLPTGREERVYVFPEDIHQPNRKKNYVLRKALKNVMAKIDTRPEVWDGGSYDRLPPSDNSTTTEEETLFYIFNTLKSPQPDISRLDDKFAREAMNSVLTSDVYGLKTSLYEYQRRSAAYIIQKESKEVFSLDPRLKEVVGPRGQTYYYDEIEGSLLGSKRQYPDVKGGILAETMGFGKTLICLSVILATRGHLPHALDDPHISFIDNRPPDISSTTSLLDMTASATARYCLPWKRYFDDINLAHGLTFEKCEDALRKRQDAYHKTIPSTNRSTPSRGRPKAPDSRQLILSSATLVVVPPNLVPHWLHEIEKHVSENALKICVIRDGKTATPPARELAEYDIVLFSMTRFNQELGTASGDYAVKHMLKRARAQEKYECPLLSIFWFRMIVDEGHNFAARPINQIHVERRWVVSGTPSKGLYGTELLHALQNDPAPSPSTPTSSLLESRRLGGQGEAEHNNMIQLKAIISGFLALKPWSNPKGQDPANWSRYMEPVGPDKRRTKSPTLRRILQSLVVRHRPDDISSQIELPPLSNTVVYLEPTFYDKLTLNLFIAALVVNAITSERTGKDYMFSPGNRKFVNELITNLRQAGFWWTGMKESHVSNTVSAAREYLEKNRARMSADDVNMLQQAIRIGSLAIGSPLWHALTLGEEMAVFVENFPDRGREEWTLDRLREFPTYHLSVLGISQATAAAKFVASHGARVECFEGLPGEGLRYRILFDNAYQPRNGSTATKSKDNKFALAKDPVKPQQILKPTSTGATDATDEESQSRTFTHPDIAKTRLVATASSKLTYLLDKVREYQDDEKIIVFYEHRQFGFWISEAFRLLQINFRTFGEEDTPKQRAEALLTFTESEDVRVLVMNLKQASHGLHIACASRVFIITPIWDPNVESQAIKRAHRMSQKRPVFVETLVLRGTLEEKMLERRKQMQASSEGMQNAEKHPLDDRTMGDIIKNERFLEIPQTEITHLAGRPAYLKTNAQLFHKNAVQPNPAPPVVGPPSLSVTPSTTPSRSRLRAVQQGQPPAMTPQRLDTIFTTTPGRGRGRGRTPRPRPTFTSPIGISYENSPRSYRTPRNSPGKRRQQSQDAGPALPLQPPAAGSSRKKRRVAFATMPEDPFLDAPSEQGPSGD